MGAQVPHLPLRSGVDARRGAGGAVQPRGGVAASAPGAAAGGERAGPAGLRRAHRGGEPAALLGGPRRLPGGPGVAAGAGRAATGPGGGAPLGAGAAAPAADPLDRHRDGQGAGPGQRDLRVRDGPGEPVAGAGQPAGHPGPLRHGQQGRRTGTGPGAPAHRAADGGDAQPGSGRDRRRAGPVRATDVDPAAVAGQARHRQGAAGEPAAAGARVPDAEPGVRDAGAAARGSRPGPGGVGPAAGVAGAGGDRAPRQDHGGDGGGGGQAGAR